MTRGRNSREELVTHTMTMKVLKKKIKKTWASSSSEATSDSEKLYKLIFLFFNKMDKLELEAPLPDGMIRFCISLLGLSR
jgi:hypothetical protein